MDDLLTQRLADLLERIRMAELRYQRPVGSVALIAVSKAQPASAIAQLASLGQRCFGENYLQEAIAKITTLHNPSLEWHFIGAIQSNKTEAIAKFFSWVHSVDRVKVARRLNDQRGTQQPPLNLCIQVNVSQATSKGGVDLDAVAPLATAIATLPRLKLRGLMALPAATAEFTAQRRDFARLRQTFELLNEQGYGLDTLSMGMSSDLEAAIAEGATHVRIGSALFGPRHYPIQN